MDTRPDRRAGVATLFRFGVRVRGLRVRVSLAVVGVEDVPG